MFLLKQRVKLLFLSDIFKVLLLHFQHPGGEVHVLHVSVDDAHSFTAGFEQGSLDTLGIRPREVHGSHAVLPVGDEKMLYWKMEI